MVDDEFVNNGFSRSDVDLIPYDIFFGLSLSRHYGRAFGRVTTTPFALLISLL